MSCRRAAEVSARERRRKRRRKRRSQLPAGRPAVGCDLDAADREACDLEAGDGCWPGANTYGPDVDSDLAEAVEEALLGCEESRRWLRTMLGHELPLLDAALAPLLATWKRGRARLPASATAEEFRAWSRVTVYRCGQPVPGLDRVNPTDVLAWARRQGRAGEPTS